MNAKYGKKLGLGVLLAAALLAGGCSSGPKVLPATPHAAVTTAQVALIQKQPKEYEQLGTLTLEVTPNMKWDEGGNADLAFEAMKKKAAALGANGLLLWSEPGTFDNLTTAGFNNTFYQVPIKQTRPHRTAIAQAIYVIKH